MSIVKYRNPKSGIMYAYESTANWDPVAHRNHPKRTYLGKVDPETGEIIKTAGKRGRHPTATNQQSSENHSMTEADGQYQELRTALDEAQACIKVLRAQNEVLNSDNARMRKVLASIGAQSAEFVHQA